MFWMLTASASHLPAVPPTELEPLDRIWGGGADCDATQIFLDAAAKFEHRDTPGEMIHHNMHVIEAWDQGRTCGSIRRDHNEWFAMWNFGQVLMAGARNAMDRDPVRAAELATEAFVFGNDASAGPIISTMMGAAVHLDALDVLAEVWPQLPPQVRRDVSSQLRQARNTTPPMDFEAERATMERVAEATTWWPSLWTTAYEGQLQRVERALSSDNPHHHLVVDRAPTWTEWLAGAPNLGIEAITLEHLDGQDRIEAELVQLEATAVER